MQKWFLLFSVLILQVLVACSSVERASPQPTDAIIEETRTPVLTAASPAELATHPPTSTQAIETTTPTHVPLAPEPEPTFWEPQSPEKICEPSNTKTCTVLYILADQYDDEHVLKTSHHFEMAGYTTFVASNTLEEINGFHECYDFTPAYPDLLLKDVDVADYDAILFAGSDGISTILHGDLETHRIAQDALEQGKVIAAAGDGPVILARAGALEGKTVSVLSKSALYGITDQWINAVERRGAIYSDRSLVRDNLLVTADLATGDFARGIIEVMEEQ
ncbi:DJ-1/PfpI family protein [Chloroflexota bacterium]